MESDKFCESLPVYKQFRKISKFEGLIPAVHKFGQPLLYKPESTTLYGYRQTLHTTPGCFFQVRNERALKWILRATLRPQNQISESSGFLPEMARRLSLCYMAFWKIMLGNNSITLPLEGMNVHRLSPRVPRTQTSHQKDWYSICDGGIGLGPHKESSVPALRPQHTPGTTLFRVKCPTEKCTCIFSAKCQGKNYWNKVFFVVIFFERIFACYTLKVHVPVC